MELEELRKVLFDVAQRQPGMLLGILHRPHDNHHHPGGDVPDWCSCGRCKQMPTLEEMVCCRQPADNCLSLSAVSCFFIKLMPTRSIKQINVIISIPVTWSTQTWGEISTIKEYK